MKRTVFLSLTFFLGLTLKTWPTVNKSIQISSGTTVDHSLSSVNGSVRIGDNCSIRGSCSSVNGRVEIGNHTRTDSVSSVNGSIRIGDESVISGEVHTVNGSIRIGETVTVADGMHTVNGGITCAAGSKIGRNLNTVNGGFNLNRTIVGGDITTVNGHIDLVDRSVIEGSIHIKRKHRFSFFRIFSHLHWLHIRLSGGSQVNGNIVVDEEDMKVAVHIAEGCTVKGKIRNADVIRD